MEESKGLAVLTTVGVVVFLSAQLATHAPLLFFCLVLLLLLALGAAGGGGGDHPCGPGGESGTNP